MATIAAGRAHHARPAAAQPDGWAYPFACCSGFDCRAVANRSVQERPEGYVVPSGEVVGYADTRVRPSPDGDFHWCSVAGRDDGRTICLFVPPRAF
ncbi:MAG: hypothetical protein ABJ021_15060 [Nitratireductor sp.]